MDALARHQAPVNHKHEDDGMHFERAASAPNAERDVGVRPAVADPPCHGGREPERSRNRRAFKVLGFAGRVFGQHSDGDVEAREAGQAAEDEEGEEDVVEGRADAHGEGGSSGGDAEGDLRVVLAPACHCIEVCSVLV
jgi:hypothetical protein